jgi:hypothetical protein
VPCNKPCGGCALTKGAAANTEPNNHLAAMIAVLGPFPFYCHDAMDWRNDFTHYLPPRLLKQRGELNVCEGWKREVRDLAETGYYGGEVEDKRLRRTVARAALVALRDFLTEGIAPGEKESARLRLGAYLRELVERKAKFQKGRAVALGLE